MKKQIQRAAFFFGLTISATAWAQQGMMTPGTMGPGQWGTGQYFGAAACGYGMKVPKAIRAIEKERKSFEKEKSKAERELSAAKRELRDMDRGLDRHLNKYNSNVKDKIIEHLKSGGICTESTQHVSQEEWNKVCPKDDRLKATLCDGGTRSTTYIKACKDAFEKSGERYVYGDVFAEVERLEKEIEDLDEDISTAESDRDEAMEEYQDKVREGKTEAGCIECELEAEERQGPGKVQTALALSMDVGSILGNIYVQKKAINMAGNLGYPYYPYPSSVNMYPMYAAGLYGAVYGGIGQGSVGCAPTMAGGGNPMGPFGMAGPFGMGNPYGTNGGMFGYPPWMNAGMSGNMMLPGMGPWGSMGGPLGGQMGGMMGPIGGMMAMGGGFGIAMGGMQMGGMQMGGMPFPGMQMGGMQMGGMPFPGMQMGGMQMGGMPFPGMQMGGMQMGGMPFPGMQMGGMQMGGMQMGGPMGMDYYNQMMQQQMMMYQMQVEYQRVYQEQYQAKYRIVMSLYQELQSLQMRLSQAYQGLYTGGGIGGGIYGGGGIGGGIYGGGGVWTGTPGIAPGPGSSGPIPGGPPPPPNTTR